ncbi:sarcosine oxidase subunit delta [Komagataeibacter europaeus]|uniref:sarcosine oxidase subunit delta n=1 Tax=Komagataeibacter europaeus TaxID=33995 RepID=UPI000B3EBF11|nr:sarcosine oxidase subunit delta [Komagataeibacter europaeus]ARW15931.1 Sarcosine oxidase [Komagataeibacter europaeus]
MRLNCPCCGPRGLEEFTYRGDATVRRPAVNATASDWVDYVYLRDNPAGWHRELWYHAAGCHAWLVVTRDTRTHEIADVTRAVDIACHDRKSAAS